MGLYSSPSNLPTNLSLNAFKSAIDSAGQYAKSCRFLVMVQGAGSSVTNLMSGARDFIYLCEAVEFPGRGFDVTNVRYNGPGQVFPSNVLYQQASLSFVCRTESKERALFDDWMDIINPTSNWNYEYADNYYGTIQIYQLAEYASKATQKPYATYGWQLNKAWPTLVAPQQVTWADQDILRLQVTFAYKYWDRPNYQK